MAKLFDDRTVVITGGSSGLGLALGRMFLEHGAFVYLLARDPARLAAAAEALSPNSPRLATLSADVTSESDVSAAFDRIRRERSAVNVLVNAAGISSRSAILETTPEQFQTLWDLNFLGAVRCARAAADDLIASRGHLINIGSLASKVVSPYLGAYPASKFALAAYSQQLRLEHGASGLHVLLVCPGPLQRSDSGHRYDHLTGDLPESARRPGGGVSLNAIDTRDLARRILRACRRRDSELVVPGKVRWLAALAQLSPSLGDWIIRRKTAGARAT